MTIKLIEERKIRDGISHFDTECPMCRSRVSFEMKDGEISWSLGYPESISVPCPSCGAKVGVGLFTDQQAMAWRDRHSLTKKWWKL